ncbi:MAG: hypothetical protein EKK54_09925 [Neisseriaceae bacterium]|nr:MAG: hypothetical protein EKK54_09925 [Neisseriaceae bacterium]
MKKFNNLLTILIVSSASFTLAACGSGGSANNAATQQTNSSSGGNNAASNNTLPQVSTDDLKAIFTALATDNAKSTISLQDAVAIITGKNPDALQTLKSLQLSGYQQAINAANQVPHVTINQTPTQAQYNEALFAALFIGDVTDSSSGSDGTSTLGQITWSNTLSNLAMVSHRFFGGYRLAQQDYTWSFNPGTLETIVNTGNQLGTAQDINLLNIHQGAVGDCYFLSTLSGLIYQRGAQSVANIFHPNESGGYSIDYTDVHSVAQQISVTPVTDLEVATGAYSAGSGQWLSYLEKAFGDVLMSPEYSFIYFGTTPATPGSIYNLATFYDGMTASQLPIGQYYSAFKFLTGHEVYEFTNSYNASSTDYTLVNTYADNPDSANITLGAKVTPANMVNLIDPLLAEGRVMVLGTPVDTKELNGATEQGAVDLPPGIVGTHAYAILGHANGKFKLRNPWGTNFTPNGADSITNGYTMQDGIFYVPDADVFKIFDQIDIEQLPSLDKTPIVVNGIVQKDSNGNPLYTAASNPIMDQYTTSNGAYIKNNYSKFVAVPK